MPSPVGAEGRESEHGHPHGGELDDRDQLAAQLPEHPLVEKVPRGVHRDAGEQQQRVSGGQVGDEDAGDAPHGAVGDEDLHQQDVAQQAHRDDEQVEGRDHTADHQLRGGRVGGGQEIPLRHPWNEAAPVGARRLGEVAKRFGGHGLLSRSFHAPRCPEGKAHWGSVDVPLSGTSLLSRRGQGLGWSLSALSCFSARGGTLAPADSEFKKKKEKKKRQTSCVFVPVNGLFSFIASAEQPFWEQRFMPWD